MEQQTPNKYVTVAYELYTDNDQGIHELVEKAPIEHPFQFISGLGIALDSFESKILALAEGEAFDFVLKVDEAYGPYEQDHVIELPKETFAINGRFDKDMVYPGAVLPLVNADGMRFQGLVLELKDNTVIIDLNHPLAGKDLHFKGQVVPCAMALTRKFRRSSTTKAATAAATAKAVVKADAAATTTNTAKAAAASTNTAKAAAASTNTAKVAVATSKQVFENTCLAT